MSDRNQRDDLHDVLGQVAFQMKNAINTIHGSLQRVAPQDARDSDPVLDENAAVLTRDFYRLLRLSTNLEEAAAMEGELTPPEENGDIIALCAAVVDRAQYAAQMLGLTLTFRSDRRSHIIALDADRVERMLLNLISNAFKFTPRGGKVSVDVYVHTRETEIRITDNGSGIRPDLVEHVFECYQRSILPDGSPRGLGLGLPISRKIARDHGGTVMLFDGAEPGTCVVATLENRKAPPGRMGNMIEFDYAGGFDHTLLELSDALPGQAYLSKLID